MIAGAQVLLKVLETKDYSLIEDNVLTIDYFPGLEKEYNYIKDFYTKYGSIPDKATFFEEFKSLPNEEISENNEYLIDKVREVKLYNDSISKIQKAVDLLSLDANKGVEYIQTTFKDIKPTYAITGEDIIQNAVKRHDLLVQKREHFDEWYFKSGFDELDKVITGIQRKEELLVIFARTNQGKSWIAEKMAVSVWEQGYNVGYFSPEMTADSIGIRYDTLYKNFSNKELVTASESLNSDEYKKYLEDLSKHTNTFLVTTPLDFNKEPTITKLRQWIKLNDLDIIIIDGLSYLKDERYRRGDNDTKTLTNLSEDLMSLSIEMEIPIVAVVQSNREAVNDNNRDGIPALEHIRGSDGVAHNASKVIAMRQKNNLLILKVQKQRNGTVGNELYYLWNIDTGEFVYSPNPKSGLDETDLIMDLKNQSNPTDLF